MASVNARRRCEHCRKLLPEDARSQQRYCSAACVARVYRRRKAAAEKQALTTPIIGTETAALLQREGAEERRLLAWQRCPSCDVIVWAGVRRRADARYCSDACRVRAARARAKAREHDDQP